MGGGFLSAIPRRGGGFDGRTQDTVFRCDGSGDFGGSRSVQDHMREPPFEEVPVPHQPFVYAREGCWLESIPEKGTPSLRWRPPMAHQVLGHRRLRDLDAQLLQLPVSARRAPEGPPTSRYSPGPWRDGGSAAGPASNGGARILPGRGRTGGGSCGRVAVRSLGHHGWESSRPGHRGGSSARGFRSVDASRSRSDVPARWR